MVEMPGHEPAYTASDPSPHFVPRERRPMVLYVVT